MNRYPGFDTSTEELQELKVMAARLRKAWFLRLGLNPVPPPHADGGVPTSRRLRSTSPCQAGETSCSGFLERSAQGSFMAWSLSSTLIGGNG